MIEVFGCDWSLYFTQMNALPISHISMTIMILLTEKFIKEEEFR